MRHAVLQIDSETTWRGGQNQIRMLLTHPAAAEWTWHLAAPPGSEVIRRLGSHARPVPTHIRGLGMFTAAVSLATHVRKHRIAIVHCQTSRAHNVGLLIRALVPWVRLVVHRRVTFPPTPSIVSRRKYLSSRVDRYICVSKAVAQSLIDFGVPAERIATVYSAINPSPFAALDRRAIRDRLEHEWQLDAATPIIGNVAYLTAEKGHTTLLLALGELRRQGTPFFCYIAGAGPLEPSLRALALEQQLDERCLRFLGVRGDLVELLAATDVFALSSNVEGLGTSLLDAVYAGCALVATNVGGIPEVIEDGRTGLLSPPRQPGVFAQQLGRVIKDSQLRLNLARAAMAHVERTFSWTAMVEGNLRVYDEVLGRR